MSENLERLCLRLNYQFKSPRYLKQALTHRSMGTPNNERFEFLGDSILNFVIANALFEQFPDKSEGELSRLRASLVKGETLALIALDLDLGDYLYLGQGELRSGGHRRASTLADAVEAIFCAVFMDSSFEDSKRVILHLYKPYLADKNLEHNLKDYKTQLQEALQAQKKPLPVYTLTRIEGEEHEQVFYVSCEVASYKLVTTGQGDTRRKAEQEAARELLLLLPN